MDARPQRPLRPAPFQDENIAPSLVPDRLIHQRNKSTPALTALLHANTLQPAPKRTAFGDVSNTSRGLQPIKDDSSFSTKAAYVAITGALKENTKSIVAGKAQVSATQQNVKVTGLLRPAQRPLSSVAGPKGNLANNATGPVASEARQATVRAQSQQAQQATNSRNNVSRRNTTAVQEKRSTVFKESPAPTTQGEVDDTTASVCPRLAPRSAKSQPHIRPENLSLKHDVKTISGDNKASISKGVLPLASVSGVYIRSDPASHNDTNPATSQAPKSVSETKQSQNAVYITDPPQQDDLKFDNHLEPIDIPYDYVYKESAQIQDGPLPEADDDWDGDEYEEYYEAEGYTTARSLRSRSENTTEGATRALAPKFTAKVQNEIEAARIFVQGTKTEEDVIDEAYDTSMVAEYGEEIFQYMRELEERMRPNPHYMENQQEIQWSMRGVLMDWLVQVHHRFTLLPETLFLCVNYIDRFLSCKVVSLGKLQLVGATAIFVAAKYEEINCPSVQEIVYMVDGGYTVDEILKAERFMLSMLQFELGWPGPMSFLRRISKADDYDLETRTLAKYFLELGIVDERFVGVVPSFWAAAAHCLARLVLRKGDWSLAHVYYSNYTYSQLRPLLSVMLECCETPQRHHNAVFEKFADKRYNRASLFVEAEVAKGFQLPALRRESNTGTRGKSELWRTTARRHAAVEK